MDILDLSDFFKTKAEAQDSSTRLSTISEMVYQEGFDIGKVLMEQFGLQRKEKFMTLLRENNVNSQLKPELQNFLLALQNKITAIPVLTLTLAFEPREQTLQVISQWFLLNTNKQVLLDIKKDAALIAGAAIFYNGKYMDFSIKPKFEEILQKVLSDAYKPDLDQKKPDEQPALHQSTDYITFGR